jgi:hypothetical protein
MPVAPVLSAPMSDDDRMKLPRPPRAPSPADEREEWLGTASMYARHLTETGSRCHLNDGQPRFCSWRAMELPATDAEGRHTTMVGVRCTSHPGGRYLDASARLAPEDFA